MRKIAWLLALALILTMPIAQAERSEGYYYIGEIGLVLYVDTAWEEAAQNGNVFCYLDEDGMTARFAYVDDARALDDTETFGDMLRYVEEHAAPLFDVAMSHGEAEGAGESYAQVGEHYYYLTVHPDTSSEKSLSEEGARVVGAVLANMSEPGEWLELHGVTVSDGTLLGDFRTVDLDGNEITKDIFAGKKLTLVMFWGTYCSACIAFMPALAEISEAYKDQGVQVVGVLADGIGYDGSVDADAVDTAKALLTGANAKYLNIVPDDVMIDNKLSSVAYIPELCFVDENGAEVRESRVGEMSREELSAIIDELLAKG